MLRYEEDNIWTRRSTEMNLQCAVPPYKAAFSEQTHGKSRSFRLSTQLSVKGITDLQFKDYSLSAKWSTANIFMANSPL